MFIDRGPLARALHPSGGDMFIAMASVNHNSSLITSSNICLIFFVTMPGRKHVTLLG
jgi:hypothetical protein